MRHSIPRPALILASAVFTGSLGPTTAYPRVARIAVTRPVPFQVETGSSRIYVKVGATGRFGHAHGVQGRLVSGKVDLGGSGELVFDMRSFVVDPPEARQYVGLGGGVSRSDQRKTTEDMLGPFVLDVVHHPRATYTIASATPLEGQAPGDPGRYQLDGQLTLRGVARRLPIAAIVERTETPADRDAGPLPPPRRLLDPADSLRDHSLYGTRRHRGRGRPARHLGRAGDPDPDALIAIPPGEDDG